jgi:hypothetical protein
LIELAVEEINAAAVPNGKAAADRADDNANLVTQCAPRKPSRGKGRCADQPSCPTLAWR